MAERTLHYANKGFRSQVVAIASDPSDPKSKRHPIIDKEDQNLNRNLGDLEEGTKSRNRIFQKRIDDIWDCSEIWEAKLRTESREAVETITNLREEYQKHMDDFCSKLQLDLQSTFSRIDTELVPLTLNRLNKVDEEITGFASKTALLEIDKTSGEAKRNLTKLCETFSIGQQKGKIREQKFVKNANEHIQKTAQRLTDEDALTVACLQNLEDEVVETERRNARMHLYRWNQGVKKVLVLKGEMESEASSRLSADSALLDTVIESQQMLQHTVLEQFGQEEPDTEGAEKEGDKDKEDRDREGELESKGEGDGVAVDAALDSSRSSPASEKLTDRMARRKITRIENK